MSDNVFIDYVMLKVETVSDYHICCYFWRIHVNSPKGLVGLSLNIRQYQTCFLVLKLDK